MALGLGAMMLRVLVGAFLATLLTGALMELSCVAGEARARAPRPSLFTAVPEPELPIASELEDVEFVDGAALTR